MSPDDFVAQLERPYWSPLHPTSYIIHFERAGTHRRTGWGILWPKHMGMFNLIWLLSGIGGPPQNYSPYKNCVTWVNDNQQTLLRLPTTGRLQTLEQVALRPLRDFASIYETQVPQLREQLCQLESALAVRL